MKLPLYSHAFNFEGVTVYGHDVLLVEPKRDLDLNVVCALFNLIWNRYQIPCCLILKQSRETQRKNLMLNNIMFIDPYRYIHMPYVGLMANDIKRESVNVKLYPQDQFIALYFAYIKQENVSPKEIVEKTGINKVSVGRALAKLEELGLVEHDVFGVSKIYRIKCELKEYRSTLLRFMRNPVVEKYIIKRSGTYKLVKAGYTALSNATDVSDNSYRTYAASKKDVDIYKDAMLYEDGLMVSDNYSLLEVWCYEPSTYSVDGCCDPMSLIRSMTAKDERTEFAIKELEARL